MKKYIIIFSAVFLLMPFLALGQDNANQTVTSSDSNITAEDLEVSNPGLLPTSRLYFLKEFGRGLRRTFTFNAVNKAELELKIANEKAAELKKVSENNPNGTGLEKAIANYKENVQKLKIKLESLKETSENPNIDKLLEKLTDRSLKHQQLFEDLKAKHSNLKNKLEDAQVDIDKTIAELPNRLDSAEKFKERVKRVAEKQGEKTIKRIGNAVDALGRLEDKIKNDTTREKILEVKKDLTKKFEKRPKMMIKKSGMVAEEKKLEVVYKNKNFSPSRLEVKKGDKVTWVNRDSSATWPASGPHPSHTGYAGFDALRGLNTGETYFFTFDKVGSWKYHDHLNPSVTGIIVVTE